MAITHGGSDSGPRVRIDLSTNANPLGPSPMAQAAMNTPIQAYPDPNYVHTRQVISAHTGYPVEEIVVGAGATELIYRLIQAKAGPVAAPVPGFGEYLGAAHIHHCPALALPGHPDDGPYTLPTNGIAFITQPGSPDGRIRDHQWCATMQAQSEAKDTWLIWDLAYANLTTTPTPLLDTTQYPGAILLFAPNKAHGCTGLRAGWLRAPEPIAQQLRDIQMSWILSAPGAAFLAAQASQEADQWVRESNLVMQRMGETIANVFSAMGWPTIKGHTAWTLTKPNTREHLNTLRATHAIKVRDLASQGMKGWWRVGVPHPGQLDEVQAALMALVNPA